MVALSRSTWLIYTSETEEQIWKRISDHVDKDDYALIIEVAKDHQGWLPKEVWDGLINIVNKRRYIKCQRKQQLTKVQLQASSSRLLMRNHIQKLQ